jgi:hypothetical protein
MVVSRASGWIIGRKGRPGLPGLAGKRAAKAGLHESALAAGLDDAGGLAHRDGMLHLMTSQSFYWTDAT